MNERSLLDQQIEYYRRRAGEYDRTAYGDRPIEVGTRIDRVLARLEPRGIALEIACGTGVWTQRLAPEVTQLTALDSADEALTLARNRLGDRQVQFSSTDVFQWQPSASRCFDTIFMAFWLSHVPSMRWDSFFASLASWLAPGGRVLIVDEFARQGGKERPVVGATPIGEVVARTLEDGSVHHIVKTPVDPVRLTSRLTALGWTVDADVDPGADADWVIASATPRESPH